MRAKWKVYEIQKLESFSLLPAPAVVQISFLSVLTSSPSVENEAI
jgi:hypothetical protein